MQYNIIMDLYFYDFQNILNSYVSILEERNEEEEKLRNNESKKYSGYNANNIMKNAQSNIPKMNNSYNIPKMHIPRL